jgi:dTDP-4-dehydrorhamnose 3,5-epimerase
MVSSSFFSSDVQDKIYLQVYPKAKDIEGVQFFPTKNILSDEGDFSELLRLDDQGKLEILPDFSLKQINRTRMVAGSVKAWHVHQKQDEIWYVSPYFQLFIGLWDLREHSKTKGKTMRINLGISKSGLLFIPKGVAHGSANLSQKDSQLFYFVNQKFDVDHPDEYRIPWDALGTEFWAPERD